MAASGRRCCWRRVASGAWPWNVLILGGGFGGLTAARRLERKLAAARAKVTLVNDVNFMLYTPLLPGAAGGTLEPRHVVVPLREQLQPHRAAPRHVTGADPDRGGRARPLDPRRPRRASCPTTS